MRGCWSRTWMSTPCRRKKRKHGHANHPEWSIWKRRGLAREKRADQAMGRWMGCSHVQNDCIPESELFEQGKHLHILFPSVGNASQCRNEQWPLTFLHLLQNIYRQFPAIFSETNHNPLCLPVCLHKHEKIHEATGVLNRLNPLDIQEMQIKSPRRQNFKKLKIQRW